MRDKVELMDSQNKSPRFLEISDPTGFKEATNRNKGTKSRKSLNSVKNHHPDMMPSPKQPSRSDREGRHKNLGDEKEMMRAPVRTYSSSVLKQKTQYNTMRRPTIVDPEVKQSAERVNQESSESKFILYLKQSSLCIFHQDSAIRKLSIRIISSNIFENSIILLILLAAVQLALDEPMED